MTTPPHLVRHSRFLCRVLRHAPESVGLELDAGGWAAVADVLAALERAGRPLDEEQLRALVDTDSKRRYALSEDRRRIRASYGHSIPVDLGLIPREPPVVLFHGTAGATVAAILARGIEPRGRQLVHLSEDARTARTVGARHGRACVLVVEAGRLAAAGHEFFRADGGTWLTRFVPPEYVRKA